MRSGCLHYMPRGISNTLNHMHVALLYYVGMGALYHAPQISEVRANEDNLKWSIISTCGGEGGEEIGNPKP